MTKKEIPTINGDFGYLHQMLPDSMKMNLLMAALDLDIFSALVYSHDADTIAKNHQLHAQNTGHLLDALAAIDLVRKNDGQYQNSPLADEFLVKGKETYLGDYFRICYPWYTITPEKMCQLVREGPVPVEDAHDLKSEELWAYQARNTMNYQRAGMAQMIISLISNLPEYPQFSKMLDLGCGPGLYGISIVMNHPTMNGVLFDQPSVIEVAKENVREYDISDKVSCIPGNYLTDTIGNGYDLILASMTLNLALDSFDALMSKIHDALNPGGVFVTLSDGRYHEGTKPMEMVLCMLLSDLSGQRMAIKENFISDSLIKAGFQSVFMKKINSPVGEIECNIGRKK